MQEYLDAIKEYASIRRGEHPSYTGDRIANSEEFAFRIGYDFPLDAPFFVQSLRDSTTEYQVLTGLPPRSLELMALAIKAGAKKGLRQAKTEGRG